MRKRINTNLFCCSLLAISLIFIGGCDSNDENSDINNKNQKQIIGIQNDSTSDSNDKDKSIINIVEINELKNLQLKEVVDDKGETLKNGVYGCISREEGNYYIFINGVDYWHSNITFNIKDKLLTIKYDTKYEKGIRVKQLFLIVPKNAESPENPEKVELINNGNKEAFKILFNN